MKQYGNENTHLKLNDKAAEVYSNTDPLRIFEKPQEDGTYLYDMDGCYCLTDQTADEINVFLSDQNTREVMTMDGDMKTFDELTDEDKANIEANWNSYTERMVDSVREDLNRSMAPCSDMEFLEAYLKEALADLTL